MVAYGDIERNKKEINLSRLEQIAKILGVTVSDILNFGDKRSNLFKNCTNTNGINYGGQTVHYYDARELTHQLEIYKLKLENAQLELAKVKVELEALRTPTTL